MGIRLTKTLDSYSCVTRNYVFVYRKRIRRDSTYVTDEQRKRCAQNTLATYVHAPRNEIEHFPRVHYVAYASKHSTLHPAHRKKHNFKQLVFWKKKILDFPCPHGSTSEVKKKLENQTWNNTSRVVDYAPNRSELKGCEIFILSSQSCLYRCLDKFRAFDRVALYSNRRITDGQL